MQSGSCECSKTELDVLSVPPTMTSMQESQWVEHFPVASIANDSPIEFMIPPQTEFWTDLSQSFLYVKFKIIQAADDSALANDANIAPVNNFLHSMFSNIDLYLNNKLITSGSNNYPYRAYIENLLSYSPESKKTHLRAGELWIKDTAGHMTDAQTEGNNAGAKQRIAAIAESKTVELFGRLHLDVFLQEKYLPNGVEIRLRLNKSRPEFCIIQHTGEPKVKIQFESVSFHVRNVELSPVVANNLNQLIAQNNMKIPIRRVEVKTFSITNGTLSKVEDHLFQG